MLEAMQGKGIGKQLFQEMKTYLTDQQFSNMALWVLKDNPSRGFYEAQGGTYVTEKTITIGDQELIEVAYGWQLSTQSTT
jgi:GNAT superfamily N-acetyltransferase